MAILPIWQSFLAGFCLEPGGLERVLEGRKFFSINQLRFSAYSRNEPFGTQLAAPERRLCFLSGPNNTA